MSTLRDWAAVAWDTLIFVPVIWALVFIFPGHSRYAAWAVVAGAVPFAFFCWLSWRRVMQLRGRMFLPARRALLDAVTRFGSSTYAVAREDRMLLYAKRPVPGVWMIYRMPESEMDRIEDAGGAVVVVTVFSVRADSACVERVPRAVHATSGGEYIFPKTGVAAVLRQAAWMRRSGVIYADRAEIDELAAQIRAAEPFEEAPADG